VRQQSETKANAADRNAKGGIRPRALLERRYLTSVADNEFRLLRDAYVELAHEYCKLERAVLFGYEA